MCYLVCDKFLFSLSIQWLVWPQSSCPESICTGQKIGYLGVLVLVPQFIKNPFPLLLFVAVVVGNLRETKNQLMCFEILPRLFLLVDSIHVKQKRIKDSNKSYIDVLKTFYLCNVYVTWLPLPASSQIPWCIQHL